MRPPHGLTIQRPVLAGHNRPVQLTGTGLGWFGSVECSDVEYQRPVLVQSFQKRKEDQTELDFQALCVEVITPLEIDFHFSLLQPAVSYRGFEDGISRLKQVTGHDHYSVQHYIIGIIAGAVPRQFLIMVHALIKFHYLAQSSIFSKQSPSKLMNALKLFHNNKDAIVQAGGRNNSWEIPKLELLQSVVSSIRCSGPVIQWSANTTEHAHVQEIKVPARLSNNQNYYDQITHYLDCSDKCFHFNVATHFQAWHETFIPDNDHDHDVDSDSPYVSEHMNVTCQSINYFAVTDALLHGSIPSALKPHCTFSNSTTTFHIANKLSLHITVDEAATLFGILDLHPAIWEFLQHSQDRTDHPVSGVRTQHLHCPLPFDHIHIWYKLRVQQSLYHDKGRVDAPQMR